MRLTGKQRQTSSAGPREPVTLVLADPEIRACRGLSRRFSPARGFRLAGVPEDPADIVGACRRMAPCVLVIDEALFLLLDKAGFAVSVDYGRAVQVIVTGAEKDETAIQDLLQKGCMGFLPHGAPPALLKRAVRAVARGELWVDRRVVTRVVQQLLSGLDSPKLTPRERDILALIAAGCRNRAIAEQLSISYETVRWHIRGLHAKLGVQDRLGTALYAQHMLAHDRGPNR